MVEATGRCPQGMVYLSGNEETGAFCLDANELTRADYESLKKEFLYQQEQKGKYEVCPRYCHLTFPTDDYPRVIDRGNQFSLLWRNNQWKVDGQKICGMSIYHVKQESFPEEGVVDDNPYCYENAKVPNLPFILEAEPSWLGFVQEPTKVTVAEILTALNPFAELSETVNSDHSRDVSLVKGDVRVELKKDTGVCGDSNKPEFPLIGFTWKEASDLCEVQGKRLPTGAEWDYYTEIRTDISEDERAEIIYSHSRAGNEYFSDEELSTYRTKRGGRYAPTISYRRVNKKNSFRCALFVDSN